MRCCIANTAFQGQHDAAALERIGEATAHAARALARELRSA